MSSPSNTNEQLTTLYALGREVASVLDLDELLHKIPQLIARFIHLPMLRRQVEDYNNRSDPAP